MKVPTAIVFELTESFPGNGFFARVVVRGRALLEFYGEEGYVLFGVEPSGIGGGGQTPREAFADFREGVRSVLFDFAAEASDFADLDRLLDQIRNATPLLDRQWTEARQALRERRTEGGDPGDLPIIETFEERGVLLTEIKSPSSDLNVTAEEPKAAA